MHASILFLSALALGAIATACSTPTNPHAMSADEHERLATERAREADTHASSFDADARARKQRCHDFGRQYQTTCWTTEINPTEGHRKEAEKLRAEAAEHRAASQALRDAEASACRDVSAEDRDISPFFHTTDIASVDAMYTPVPGSIQVYTPTGVRIRFHPIEGMTEDRMRALVGCHLARASALGHAAPELGYCPLAPKGVQAKVSSASDGGVVVEITTSDPETAKESLRRARALVDMPR